MVSNLFVQNDMPYFSSFAYALVNNISVLTTMKRYFIQLSLLINLVIILRYMLPSFLSHIIASITLAIPGMILAETSLSFLGLGLRPPVVSWGVLLKEAQNVRAVATAPWLLLAAVPVIVTVLVLNFLGDGLRDAADPYSR